MDLAHQFNTDVRVLRFLRALPAPPEDVTDHQEFFRGFSRTLSEAIRFAASELLDIDAREIRATYRSYGAGGTYIEVVIYDGAAGGAGYCRRLGSKSNLGKLLLILQKRLNCPAKCSSGCRSCLADYSNQKWWDCFDRNSVLDWINELEFSASTRDGLDAWTEPSFLGLNKFIRPHTNIWLIGPQLLSNNDSQESIDLLIQWLAAGKTVNIIILHDFEKWLVQSLSSNALAGLRRIHSWVKDGSLRLFGAPDSITRSNRTLPRIFASGGIGAPVVLSDFPLAPVLEKLLPEPIYIGEANQNLSIFIKEIIDAVKPYKLSSEILDSALSKIEIFDLGLGVDRDFKTIFSRIIGGKIKSLSLLDPYCAAGEKNREKLHAFFIQFLSVVGSHNVEQVNVECKEQQSNAGQKPEHPFQVARLVEQNLEAIGINNHRVSVLPIRTPKSRFHDREIYIDLIDQDGCSMKFRFILTGGIDYLMNSKCDTKVICQQLGIG